MPLVDIVHRIVWLGRRVLDTPFCKELLTLNQHMDTSAPDINLCAMRAIDILENVAFSRKTCHLG